MNFPATDYALELAEPFMGRTGFWITTEQAKRAVRAPIKKGLPKGHGLIPQGARAGAFGLKIWILRDDWGKILVSKHGEIPDFGFGD